ncbi:hypothetical protein Scep_009429 [Stephania cephalantha]|uniref:FAF domain-containing protein n=1 Tax=Stephania cephalantha TaxID=152367 RepID=A0AAP0PCJ0_9MAGN
MSSAVCHGLQSCLEPRFVEPITMGLKVVVGKPNFLQPTAWERRQPPSSNSVSYYDEGNIESNTNTNTNSNRTSDNLCKYKSNNDSDNEDRKDTTTSKLSSGGDMGGWSFIQALTTNKSSSTSGPVSMEGKKDENQQLKKLYVHPLNKQSSIKLSDKSLEYCTENLGCETGSTTSEDIDFSSLSSPSSPSSSSSCSSDSESFKSPTRQRSRRRALWHEMKDNSASFPPPLTSITGSNRLNIRPYREGGRLVMKASVVPSCHTNFQAERSHGRLILRFQRNSPSSFDSDSAAIEGEEKQSHQQQEEEHGVGDGEFVGEEDIDGIKLNVGGGMGMRKFQRPSRCMEGGKNKGLLLWEPPHLVATS